MSCRRRQARDRLYSDGHGQVDQMARIASDRHLCANSISHVDARTGKQAVDFPTVHLNCGFPSCRLDEAATVKHDGQNVDV